MALVFLIVGLGVPFVFFIVILASVVFDEIEFDWLRKLLKTKIF